MWWRFVRPQSFNSPNLRKSLLCSYKRSSWFAIWSWILWENWMQTMWTVWVCLKLKAMTVFSSWLFLWFKPYNGSFHLQALVGVFCRCRLINRWVCALWRLVVVMTVILCPVLWLDAHETFCSTSLCVHLPLRHLFPNQTQDFKSPEADPWGRSGELITKEVLTEDGVSLNSVWLHHAQNNSCKTRSRLSSDSFLSYIQ